MKPPIINCADLSLDTLILIDNNRRKGLPLYSYAEIPHFMQGNPYVTRGYRAFLTSGQCVKSICYWSNETINVWTHVIGFLLFLGLTIYDNTIMIPYYQGSTFDHVIYTGFLACYQFCMFASAGYHLFAAAAEEVSKRWLGIDYAGISVGILGCYLPGIYYAYCCFKFWRDVYLVMATTLIIVTLFMQAHPRFMTSQWYGRRLTLFSTMVAFGLAPTVHWVYLNGGFSTPIVKLLLPRVVVLYLLAVAALIFFATKFPEVCFPGKLDFIGSSHQLWHTIVVIAFLWWHQTGVIMMELTHNFDLCSNIADPFIARVKDA